MKIMTIAIALNLLPAIAFAAGCNYDRQAMSCAEGTVYDSATKTCVVDATT